MPSITLTVPPRIERQFKAAAKAAWPSEIYGLLLGTVAGDHVTIDELFIPEGVEKYCDHRGLTIRPEWIIDATEEAKEDGLVIAGDIHSHPWTYNETKGALQDRIQGEEDLDCPVQFLIAGICNVQEMKNKRLRSSIRWHGPTVHLRLERS